MGMNREFVKYEQALALKELGFDELCFRQANPNGHIMWRFLCADEEQDYCLSVESIIKSPMYEPMIGVPTYSQVFRWLRDNYKLHSTITSISQESWQWHITKPGESLGKVYDEDFYTYEEAEEACLNKLIEIVKNEKRN